MLVGPGFRGLASLDPLPGCLPWCAVPQIMEDVEVVQLVPTAGEQIVVCQCHRSCCMWRWPAFGVLPLVQLLDKVADMPVASMTGAWGRQCRKLRHPQLLC